MGKIVPFSFMNDDLPEGSGQLARNRTRISRRDVIRAEFSQVSGADGGQIEGVGRDAALR